MAEGKYQVASEAGAPPAFSRLEVHYGWGHQSSRLVTIGQLTTSCGSIALPEEGKYYLVSFYQGEVASFYEMSMAEEYIHILGEPHYVYTNMGLISGLHNKGSHAD